MTNRLLYGRIVTIYGSATKFAEAIGLTKSFVSQKLNGKVKWTKRDLDKWGPALRLDAEGLKTYFPEYFEDLREKMMD